MKKWILILAVPALLTLGACSTNPATGKHDFTAFMSVKKEMQIGAEEHPKMVKKFGGVFGDQALSAYVRNLGVKLAKTSERPNLPWTFTVLNDPLINAFALPGGYVYVTRGLLAMASDEAELAGVLSHEIGHVTARHSAQRYSSTVVANVGVRVLGVLSRAAGFGGTGGQLASMGANLALKRYSRAEELEADQLAVRYMTRQGYDPQALISFFTKLRIHQELEAQLNGRAAKTADQSNLLATHPRTAVRIAQAINLAKTSGKDAVRRNADEYLKHIDGLVFGDVAAEGLIQGRVFIHPVMKFRFKVPAGFTLKNAPDMVRATDSSGAVIKFSAASAKKVRDAGGMENFLLRKWGGNVDRKSIEWLDINGMKAVTSVSTEWNGRTNIEVRRILIEQDLKTYWRFQFDIPPGQSTRLNKPLRRTTYSFRQPTPKELTTAVGLHVQVVEVGPGVTVEDLINTMAVKTMKAKWFAALNGIKRGDTLSPGTKVKVIK